jgi:redox-sensing transcriptional repressor
MANRKFSQTLLKRLPIYLNYLRTLPENTTTISATAIARALNLGDVQVRKDLAKVSDGGRRRIGHCRDRLIQDIEQFLDFASSTGSIVVGAGKLGQALLDYPGFEESGLNIFAGFDTHPAEKQVHCEKPIFPMTQLETFCQCYDVRIGIITVPADQAQSVCDRLIACGIRAIWNFAPVHLNVPEHVVIQNENLAISLSTLRMQLMSMTAAESESATAGQYA